MRAVSSFRKALQDAVMERHCANHPMTKKWAAGELSRNGLKGIAVEHYHWISGEIEHFRRHSEVDIAHSDRGFAVLEKHCTTREMQDHSPGPKARAVRASLRTRGGRPR